MKHLINYAHYFIITLIIIGLVFIIPFDDTPVNSIATESPLIIIDAGHGGKDGGAVASDGTQEQYLNLAIALDMYEYLNNLGYRTLLTRSDDDSIHDEGAESIREQKVSDIHNRLHIMKDNPGCIFVSVHQNYYTESKYNGTQVFYSPNDSSSPVLAQYIQDSVVSTLQPDNTRQIKNCDDSIYLLYNATETAVLVECGFLSNEEEREKLKNEKYQAEFAVAVCNGIISYINSAEEITTDF